MKNLKIRKSTIENLAMFKAGNIITDVDFCNKFGISIPTDLPTDRVEATKIIGNFQMQKGFAVSEINKLLSNMRGVSLSQYSHTNYKVVSVEAKVAKVKAQINRLQNSLNTLG